MALCHDLAESSVGDITPLDGVPEAEKRRREEEALREIAGGLQAAQGSALVDLWLEYEEGKAESARPCQPLDGGWPSCEASRGRA